MPIVNIKNIVGYKKIKNLQCRKEENMARMRKPKCAAKTKVGRKCKNHAAGKSKFCSSHKKR